MNIIPSKLPKATRVFLTVPSASDEAKFLAAVHQSTALHHPWVYPPADAASYQAYVERMHANSHLGFLVKHTDTKELVGVININEIVRGVFQSGYLGFYAFAKYAGQGLMSEGLSIALQYYFDQIKLHRLEANIQPDNLKSIALVKRHGFRREGFSPRYLKIGGEWKDHERFALTVEDYT